MKNSYKITALLTGLTLLVGLAVMVSFSAFRQMEASAEARKHTFMVIYRSDDLLSTLKDAETGQRGYLLTGKPVFLEPYVAVRDNLIGQLAELRQLTSSSGADKYLNAVAPLLADKLAEMARVIELYRSHDQPAALAMVGNGLGKQLMDSIRVEMRHFSQIEEATLAQHEAEFQSNLHHLFTILEITSLVVMLLALAFAYLILRGNQQRLKNLVYHQTTQLLEVQKEANKQLQEANATLQVSEEKLAVTLHSIGDAVIATDADGRVTLLNPLAEQLTGWTMAQAALRPVDEIFNIINQETRQAAIIPVKETLDHGTIHGLANHTILIARDGSECAIADSCAPIRNRESQVVGAVLVFRDVTKEYATQQDVRDGAALVQTILNTVVDGIITVQASNGIVERANSAAQRMFGYPAAELIGQNFNLLIPELNQEQLHESLKNSDASTANSVREVVGRRKDGSVFPLEITVNEMQLGGTRYFTGILRDITTR